MNVIPGTRSKFRLPEPYSLRPLRLPKRVSQSNYSRRIWVVPEYDNGRLQVFKPGEMICYCVNKLSSTHRVTRLENNFSNSSLITRLAENHSITVEEAQREVQNFFDTLSAHIKRNPKILSEAYFKAALLREQLVNSTEEPKYNYIYNDGKPHISLSDGTLVEVTNVNQENNIS